MRMRLPGNTTWMAGTCVSEAGPRSYKVQIGDSVYRRNRRQLIASDEPPGTDDHKAQPSDDTDHTAPREQNQTTNIGPSQEAFPSSEPVEAAVQGSLTISSPRRSSRSCHRPSWMNDYVMT